MVQEGNKALIVVCLKLFYWKTKNKAKLFKRVPICNNFTKTEGLTYTLFLALKKTASSFAR